MKLCIVFFEQDSLSRAQSFSSFLMTGALMEHFPWIKVLIWGLMKKKNNLFMSSVLTKIDLDINIKSKIYTLYNFYFQIIVFFYLFKIIIKLFNSQWNLQICIIKSGHLPVCLSSMLLLLAILVGSRDFIFTTLFHFYYIISRS